MSPNLPLRRAPYRPLRGVGRGFRGVSTTIEHHHRAVIGDDLKLAAAAIAASGLGCRAVVLVRPSQATVDAIVPLLREAAPDAVVLIYTTERLSLALGEHVLLANSTLRLRGDLGVVAEEAA